MVEITAMVSKTDKYVKIEVHADNRSIFNECVDAVDWMPDLGVLFITIDNRTLTMVCDKAYAIRTEWTISETDGKKNYTIEV